MGVFPMTKKDAWNYAIGLIKVDGLEPTEDFKKLVEKEIFKVPKTIHITILLLIIIIVFLIIKLYRKNVV